MLVRNINADVFEKQADNPHNTSDGYTPYQQLLKFANSLLLPGFGKFNNSLIPYVNEFFATKFEQANIDTKTDM